MTTVNYTDCGLSAAMISELKKSYRKTAWRMKILKSKGRKLPDISTMTTLKYDGVTDLPPGQIVKLIHDDKVNRTFFLHYWDIDTTAYCVVTVINHYLGTAHADYIETMNVTNCAGWPATYTYGHANDMAYDPINQRLAIAVSGTGTGGSSLPPALFVINCIKYLDELEANTCATLKENPDYFDCAVWSGATTIVGAGEDTRMRFVGYTHNRFWTWTENDPSPGSFKQMGYFDTSGVYHLSFVHGYPPAVTDTNPKGETWDASVTYPTNPMTMAARVNALDPQAYGDGAVPLLKVVGMEVQNTGTMGEILLITSPYQSAWGTFTPSINFDYEPFILRFDCAKLVTPGTYEVIEQWDISETASYQTGYGYYTNGTTYTKTVDLSDITGLCRVTLETDPTGNVQPIESWNHLYIQTSQGTVRSVRAGDNIEPHISLFCDRESSVKIGLSVPSQKEATTFQLNFSIKIYKFSNALVDIIGVHSTPALACADDTDRPATTVYSDTESYITHPSGGTHTVTTDWNLITRNASPSKYTLIDNLKQGCLYNPTNEKYIFPVRSSASEVLGIWVYGTALNRYIAASSDIDYDTVGRIEPLDDNADWVIIAGNDAGQDNLSIQFISLFDEVIIADKLTAELVRSDSGATGVFWDYKNNIFGFSTGGDSSNWGEVWLYVPIKTDGVWEWNRDIRHWWDGSTPDMTIGATGDTGGDLNQEWTFFDPDISSSKGTASNQLTFSVDGFDYLPWNETSEFNYDVDLTGVYNGGTLADGNRIIVERGVNLNGYWNWLPEGTFFVTKSPSDLEEGLSDMNVTAGGVINMIVTRSVYKGTHRPTEQIYTKVILSSTDDTNYIYNDGTSDITDWCAGREIVVYVDGTASAAYTLTSADGIVTFPAAMTGKLIEATFSAYVSGTNEAEDIILYILRYPNTEEMGGCGLDDSYFTRLVSGDTPTTTDNLTYTMSKNMVVDSDAYNAVYRDGVAITTGFTWNYRNGTITFGADQSAYTITADYKHYTIQKSGATLRPITLNPKKQKDSFTAINEVCKQVAPNYIMREGRDGKIECDFYTQKAAASADVTITTSTDIVLTHLSIDPAYEGLATRVLSFGSGELQDLPNYCLGKTVTDLWAMGWHVGADVQTITDGNPATGATGGYGGWDEGTYANQAALIAAGVDGLPAVSIDMGEVREVETIIIARCSGAAGEGERGAVQQISIWISNDGASWTRIVDATELGPGQNQKFVAGTNYDEGTAFQHIRVNFHSLGLYTGPDGDTDSQISLSEIQCYPSTTIEGMAVMQDEDPAADHYDSTGLLEKYGYTTYIARGGEPDTMLYTQELADQDAGWVLDEVIRLLNKVEIHAPWLPTIPIFSTIRVIDAAMGTDNTFFIESRTAGADGDTYTGTTLP